ncbi:MAG: hypothetical protein LBI28_06245 [Treponema sp.]|jgi:hypothetical protein|nr:hypothetical protein [Treponema sp.]
MTRKTGKKTVHKLVDDFEKNECQYMSKSFQETETRNRFIDPFFTALDGIFTRLVLPENFGMSTVKSASAIIQPPKNRTTLFGSKKAPNTVKNFLSKLRPPMLI